LIKSLDDTEELDWSDKFFKEYKDKQVIEYEDGKIVQLNFRNNQKGTTSTLQSVPDSDGSAVGIF
jgi:hypothetical protein